MDQISARFSLTLGSTAADNFSLDVDLQLPGQGFSCIFGRSGSGKTTLLRCMAGLHRAKGQFQVKGNDWQSTNHFLPTHQRNLGYVFQEASLLPHLTAIQNIDFALRRTKAKDQAFVKAEVIQLMEIEGLLHKLPASLSGGERQRVAIARAIVMAPDLLLMDEPLASLDTHRKQEVLHYLEKLRHQFDIPIVYVSHAMDEITRLADHLVLLEDGKVLASGSLQSVLAQIELPYALGEETGVVIFATVTARDEQWGLLQADFDGGQLILRDNGANVGEQIRTRILARDVSLSLMNHEDTSILNRLQATVVSLGQDTDATMMLVKLLIGETPIIARLTRRSVANLELQVGKLVCVQVKSVAIVD